MADGKIHKIEPPENRTDDLDRTVARIYKILFLNKAWEKHGCYKSKRWNRSEAAFGTLMRVRWPKNVRLGKTKSCLIGAQGLCDGINNVEPRARPCAAIEHNVKLYNKSTLAARIPKKIPREPPVQPARCTAARLVCEMIGADG